MSERIIITLETGNAAFEDSPATEVARILRKLADDFEESGGPYTTKRLRDSTGNVVGYCTVEEL